MVHAMGVGASGGSISGTKKRGLFGVLVACLGPGTAAAEGAVQQIACTGETICDAGGTCSATPSEMAFTLSPVDVGAHGEGRYRIAYGDIEAEAIMRPDMSLIWAEGRDDLQMLTLLDPARSILVQRSIMGTGGDSTVTFLTCGEGP